MRYFWLNFHLPYACRHSGACCTAGWPIPIEPERAMLIRNGRRPIEGVLPRHANGACVFHDGRCTVYAHRPLSCVHFPYVCVTDARGVHVTLSHYCPTAASLLFDHRGPIEIVEGPPPIAGLEMPEGLDARESLPPLREDSRPKTQDPRPVLMSWDEFSTWEREAIRSVGSLAGDSEFAPVIERYLAAKVIASWHAYVGNGIDAVRESIRDAHTRLQAEIATACRDAGRALDAELLLGAIRQADLYLLHRDVR
jgi:Fe-S-cluster containining protein